MKKKLLFICLIPVLFSILIIDPISAWFPNTHNYIVDKVKEKSIATQNLDLTLCFDNPTNEQSLRTGAILPDITAIDYLNKNEDYKATHNWGFQQEVLSKSKSEDEKCLAYGIAIHLISDSVAHEKLIPLKIGKIKLPDWLIHLLVETKYDICLVRENRYLIDETRESLNAFYGDKGEKYRGNIQNALGVNTNLNVNKKIKGLSFILKILNAVVISEEFYKEYDNQMYKIIPFPQYTYKYSVGGFINSIVRNCNVTEKEDYMQETVNLIMDYKYAQ